MTLGFKKQFEKYVEEGSKRHTIRDRGARMVARWKPGVIADCFANPRQKNMRCLGRWPVVKVEAIRIFILPMKEWITIAGVVTTAAIEINGERLSLDECNGLAWRDGFRSSGRDGAFAQMMGFWCKTHNLAAEPFEGDLIHWDYDRPVGSAAERKASAVPGKPGRPRKVTA